MIKHCFPNTCSYVLVPLMALLIAAQAQAHPLPQPQLPTVQLRVGSQVVTAEFARTAKEQERGLMFRRSLPDNHGMLFVFKKTQNVCFWMRNTSIPLSIAFIAANDAIIKIDDMAPETEVGHCSGKPILYALEMGQGWFSQNRVSIGDLIGYSESNLPPL